MTPRLVALMLATAPAIALAAPLSADQARSLAATCMTCHGPGQGRAASFGPSLGTMRRDRLADTLRAYRGDARATSVMRQLARGYTDAEIDALADWFGAQRAPRVTQAAPR